MTKRGTAGSADIQAQPVPMREHRSYRKAQAAHTSSTPAVEERAVPCPANTFLGSLCKTFKDHWESVSGLIPTCAAMETILIPLLIHSFTHQTILTILIVARTVLGEWNWAGRLGSSPEEASDWWEGVNPTSSCCTRGLR